MLIRKDNSIPSNVSYRVCVVAKCNKKAYRNGYCMKHKQELYRKKHPIKWAYINFKHNAFISFPGEPVRFTLEEFAKFVEENNALKTRKGKRVYYIARKDPSRGFVIDNMHAITQKQSGKKYNTLRKNIKPTF